MEINTYNYLADMNAMRRDIKDQIVNLISVNGGNIILDTEEDTSLVYADKHFDARQGNVLSIHSNGNDPLLKIDNGDSIPMSYLGLDNTYEVLTFIAGVLD